ncbi:MAG: hypothetical protein PF693_07765 [Spirochaetia bacterium]|jgi:hypothetical protein|nr:hypothetical protein [Spirochaetia bacterium]
MIGNKLILLLSIIVFLGMSAAAEHIPDTSAFKTEYQGRVTVIADINNWNPYLEVLGNLNGDSFELAYKHLQTGAYFRINKNLKIGAFYLLQQGVRHDDDWISLNPGWEWEDSTNRLEHNIKD